MKVGIAFDLKEPPASTGGRQAPGAIQPPAIPDDLHEEFDSPATIDAIASVLAGLGHQVVRLGDGRELIQRVLADRPDFVFNFAEGQGVGRSREARVPAFLEMLGIPYTGSDPLTLAVTLDKDVARRLVASVGVVVPRGVVVDKPLARTLRVGTSFDLQLPLIAKPAWEGSSKGIRQTCIAERPEDLAGVLDKLLRDYQQPVLVEEFIVGDELTVGVIGNDPPRIVGVMRVLPVEPRERFIYSLEVKREYKKRVRYECPAPLPADVVARVERDALEAYRVLGCRDVARVDFRLKDGVPYFLEVNPLPGLNPMDSDLVILAKLIGWSYERLVGTIFDAALERHRD
jgi:D-alanine-D-alanine ligase